MSCNVLLISLSNKSVPLSVLLLLCCLLAKAQVEPDPTPSDSTETQEIIKTEKGTVTGDVEATANSTDSVADFHSPKKATIMSAVLPGLGQIYNKKWWKVPIIYGGFAVAGYFLKDNYERINLYKDAYNAATDGDPATTNNTGYSTTDLLTLIDQYKTWRDLSYISIAAIYVLNIIDANVDAHLFYFNVSEDISLNVQPYVSPFRGQSSGLTLSLKF